VPAGTRNRRNDVLLHFSVDDIESKAQSAAEAWDTHVTSFLSTKKRTAKPAAETGVTGGGRASTPR
jgi:hypothetical protein